MPMTDMENRWGRSTQQAQRPKPSALRGSHRLTVTEPGSRHAIEKIPAELGQRIMESLMAQGYRESAAADHCLAEADMAAGSETLPD
jgi:hypothetical protein